MFLYIANHDIHPSMTSSSSQPIVRSNAIRPCCATQVMELLREGAGGRSATCTAAHQSSRSADLLHDPFAAPGIVGPEEELMRICQITV